MFQKDQANTFHGPPLLCSSAFRKEGSIAIKVGVVQAAVRAKALLFLSRGKQSAPLLLPWAVELVTKRFF